MRIRLPFISQFQVSSFKPAVFELSSASLPYILVGSRVIPHLSQVRKRLFASLCRFIFAGACIFHPFDGMVEYKKTFQFQDQYAAPRERVSAFGQHASTKRRPPREGRSRARDVETHHIRSHYSFPAPPRLPDGHAVSDRGWRVCKKCLFSLRSFRRAPSLESRIPPFSILLTPNPQFAQP